jgi:hypothetical protein
MELLMLALWLGSQPNPTEVATAIGSIKLGGAALAETLPISRFAGVATAAAVSVCSMGTDHV